MSFEFLVWGEIAFPNPAAAGSWRAATVAPASYHDWDEHFSGSPGKATLTVAEVLAEYVDVVTCDQSMTYFLQLEQRESHIRVRGLVHRDGFDRMFLATFRCAADVGGRGEVLFEHSLGDGIYRLKLDSDGTSFEEASIHASDLEATAWIMDESARRAAAGTNKPVKNKPVKKKPAKKKPAKKKPAKKKPAK